MFTVKIILEVIFVLLIAYGIIHEEELIEFETVMVQWAKRGFKVYGGNRNG